jgi:hypothetical protein
MKNQDCKNEILSNEYADYIANYSISEQVLRDVYGIECFQNIENRYLVAYAKREGFTFDRTRSSITIPRLFVTLDSSASESTQVLKVRNNPFLNLNGRGVLLGFVDTGID